MTGIAVGGKWDGHEIPDVPSVMLSLKTYRHPDEYSEDIYEATGERDEKGRRIFRPMSPK